MLGDERHERLFFGLLPLDEFADAAEVIAAVALGDATRFIDRAPGMLVAQVEQSHEHTYAFDPAAAQHRRRPRRSIRAEAFAPKRSARCISQVVPFSMLLIFSGRM
jgi:hypothetical protein